MGSRTDNRSGERKRRIFLGWWRGGDWTHGRFDRAFPVEKAGILICNREALKGGACERQESEWTRRLSDLPR